MTKLELQEREKLILEERLAYLAQEYEPSPDCEESDYKCDFKIGNDDECVCQWALKLRRDFMPRGCKPGDIQ